MVAEIKPAEANYPDLVDVFSIGKSYRGRNIWAAKISDNVARRRARARGPHRRAPPRARAPDGRAGARDPPLADQGLRVGRAPCATSSTAARSSSSSPSTRTACATTSPATRSGPGARTASRTPARPPSAPTSTATTATGGAAAAARRAASRHSSTAAPSAFSAPETRAFRDFVASRVVDGVQQIKAHITLHTNGELILWPYGYTNRNVPPDMTSARLEDVRRPRPRPGREERLHGAAVVRPVHHRRRPDRLAVRDLPDLQLHLRALPVRDSRRSGRTTTPTTRRSRPRRHATGARSST